MWQRFTENARKVVFYAQEEAQEFGEGYVATEHLLLGLLRETDSNAAKLLERMGVSLNRVRVEIEKQLPRGDGRPGQDMTLTPRAKRVIDLSYDEARALNHNYIGTEHLLLGLVREGQGLAGRVLSRLGVELERCREETLHVLAESDTPEQTSGKAAPKQVPSVSKEPYAWVAYDAAAQSSILRAEEVAKEMGENQLTPTHLILALLESEDSEAAQVLKLLGLEPTRFRAEIQRRTSWAEGAPPIELSPIARQAVNAATDEAHRLGSEKLGSEHLLLGLVQSNPDNIGRVLESLGLSVDRLRRVVKILKENRDENP